MAPDIAVTTPTGRFSCLEHRALLDVELDIAMQFAADARGSPDVPGIEAELDQGVMHR